MGQRERPITSKGPAAAFAKDLRKQRDQAGVLNQRELAEMTGISQATISRALNGQMLPGREIALAIARACGGDEHVWERRWAETEALLDLAPTKTANVRSDNLVIVPSPAPSEGPLPGGPWPQPASATNAAEYIQQMKILKICVRNPSLKELERRGARVGVSLPPSTVSDALRGDRLPSFKLVTSFLAACGVRGADRDAWIGAWQRLAANEFAATPPRRHRDLLLVR